MPRVTAFHSVDQARKPEDHRIYHDNDRCFSARGIFQHQRLDGDGGYRLCVECTRLDEALDQAALVAAAAE